MLHRVIVDICKQAPRGGCDGLTRWATVLGVESAWPSLLPHPGWQASAFSTKLKQNLSNLPPSSLAWDRVIVEPKPGVEENFFLRTLLKIGGYYSKESQQIQGAKAWYNAVTEQVENPAIYEAFELEESKYRDKYAMLCLHMWITLVRLRPEGKDGKSLAQLIYENFQEDVESRVRAAGVKVRISKHLAEQEQIFFGTSLAYDRCVDGGEQLSHALLRNVYQERPDMRNAADFLSRYITRELACLAMTDSESIMKGRVKFSSAFLRS